MLAVKLFFPGKINFHLSFVFVFSRFRPVYEVVVVDPHVSPLAPIERLTNTKPLSCKAGFSSPAEAAAAAAGAGDHPSPPFFVSLHLFSVLSSPYFIFLPHPPPSNSEAGSIVLIR